MNDLGQGMMALDADVAIASVKSVNENMSQLHYHDYFEIYHLKRGERFHYINDMLLSVNPGDLIIFPPQTMHRSFGKLNVEFEREVIYFKPDVIIDQNLKDALLHSTCAYTPDKITDFRICQLIEQLFYFQNHSEPFKDVNIKCTLNLLCTTILNLQQTKAGLLRQNRTSQIITYINLHYADDISLSELAEEFHVSEFYLCREFKKDTNCTIIDFVKRIRIMNAERLFKETDKNVSEVASLTGFSNLTHFNRVFKEHVGITPSKYRQEKKEIKKNNQ